MSIKIRVSYTDYEELERVQEILSPLVKSWKYPKNQSGDFKKIYSPEIRIINKKSAQSKK